MSNTMLNSASEDWIRRRTTKLLEVAPSEGSYAKPTRTPTATTTTAEWCKKRLSRLDVAPSSQAIERKIQQVSSNDQRLEPYLARLPISSNAIPPPELPDGDAVLLRQRLAILERSQRLRDAQQAEMRAQGAGDCAAILFASMLNEIAAARAPTDMASSTRLLERCAAAASHGGGSSAIDMAEALETSATSTVSENAESLPETRVPGVSADILASEALASSRAALARAASLGLAPVTLS